MDTWLRSNLEELKDDENFVDCWFIIGQQNGVNRTFGCNKLIVSCASAVFKAMLTGEWQESVNKIINITDIEIDMFAKFRDYIYSYDTKKVAEYSFDDLIQLAHFAQKYLVQSLLGSVLGLLSERLETMTDLLKVLELAENLDNVSFDARIEKFVRKQPERLLLRKELLNLGRNSFDKYLEMIGGLVCPFKMLRLIESFLGKHGLIPNNRPHSNGDDKIFDFLSATHIGGMLAKANHMPSDVEVRKDEDSAEFHDYRRRLVSHVDFTDVSVDEFHQKISKSTVLNMNEKYEMLYKLWKWIERQEYSEQGLRLSPFNC